MSVHLVRDQCRDESGVWCDVDHSPPTVRMENDPEKADCPDCLDLAVQFGVRAARRLVDLTTERKSLLESLMEEKK